MPSAASSGILGMLAGRSQSANGGRGLRRVSSAPAQGSAPRAYGTYLREVDTPQNIFAFFKNIYVDMSKEMWQSDLTSCPISWFTNFSQRGDYRWNGSHN